jgi:hypothetical protein
MFKLHLEDRSDIFLRNADNHHAASQPTTTYRCKVAMKTYVRGREIEGLYRTRRARADGREPIRGNGIRTSREPTVRFQGGAWVGS